MFPLLFLWQNVSAFNLSISHDYLFRALFLMYPDPLEIQTQSWHIKRQISV